MPEQNEPWLDMSPYPTLPPEEAADEATLAELHSALTTPGPPLDQETWRQAVAAAVADPHGDFSDGGLGPNSCNTHDAGRHW